MGFNVDKYGDITLVQGDSGQIVINGIKTDKNYSVYLAIQDKKRKPIGTEQVVSSNNMSSVIFELTGSLTNLLKVPKNKAFEVYYYGVKICDSTSNIENTLILGKDNKIGNTNTITVFPKRVEGI